MAVINVATTGNLALVSFFAFRAGINAQIVPNGANHIEDFGEQWI